MNKNELKQIADNYSQRVDNEKVINIQLLMEEAAKRGEHKINIPKDIACPVANGPCIKSTLEADGFKVELSEDLISISWE